jgi:hypothetical protein
MCFRARKLATVPNWNFPDSDNKILSLNKNRHFVTETREGKNLDDN